MDFFHTAATMFVAAMRFAGEKEEWKAGNLPDEIHTQIRFYQYKQEDILVMFRYPKEHETCAVMSKPMKYKRFEEVKNTFPKEHYIPFLPSLIAARAELSKCVGGYIETPFIGPDGKEDICFGMEHGYVGGLERDDVVVEVFRNHGDLFTVVFE